MDVHTLIILIETEWKLETGFLGKLRLGIYDPEALARLLVALQLIKRELPAEETINLRLVSLLWFIPLFIEWQRARFLEVGRDTMPIDQASQKVTELLFEILGVP